jgi:hypothetical protein
MEAPDSFLLFPTLYISCRAFSSAYLARLLDLTANAVLYSGAFIGPALNPKSAMDQYFVTLDPPIVTSYPNEFLGRLVVDVYNPNRGYEPENPSEALAGLWEVLSADDEAPLLPNGQPHPISPVFATFLKSNGQSYSRSNIKAILLKDHHEGFQAVLQQAGTRERVDRLLDQNGNKLSMVVGLLATTSDRAGPGLQTYTIHEVAYRVLRKTTMSGYDNSMSWIDFSENQVTVGSKRFDWQNVAMGDRNTAGTPTEIQYEDEETDDEKEVDSAVPGRKCVIYLTDEFPSI